MAQMPTTPFVIPSSVGSMAQTQQSGVAGTSGASKVTIPVESTEVVAAPTIVVDAPTRSETKQAFDEVSSVLHSAASQQQEMRAEMETLSRGMEQMRLERAGELETTAQVKETLIRTMSASSSLEARLGQAEIQQAQMKSAAEEAKAASERAIEQARQLGQEQEKTTQQVSQILTAQVEETQKRLTGTASLARETQAQVRTLSHIARTADMTAKIASEQVERQVATVQ